MSDLIDRQKAVDAVLELSEKVADEMLFIDAIVNEIENIPSADPERKTGKWIYDTERVAGDGWTYSQYHCSECKFQELGGLANFCPNCGAEMRTKGNENV